MPRKSQCWCADFGKRIINSGMLKPVMSWKKGALGLVGIVSFSFGMGSCAASLYTVTKIKDYGTVRECYKVWPFDRSCGGAYGDAVFKDFEKAVWTGVGGLAGMGIGIGLYAKSRKKED
jgi:hypothetical protein